MKGVDKEAELKGVLDEALKLQIAEERRAEALSALEGFLSENSIVVSDAVDFGSTNLLINWAISYVDEHPCCEIREISDPVRAVIWKCAGIECDDYSKLRIGKFVRFSRPENIKIITGGHLMEFTGTRSGTWFDGRGKIVIFGPSDFSAGVKIFTHLHYLEDTNRPKYVHWGTETLIPCIIYPDCWFGEDSHIFGSLQMNTVVADGTITRHSKSMPPYSIVAGTGRTYRVIREVEFPRSFPPKYITKVLDSAKKNFPNLGAMLEKYLEVVKEFCETPGERIENWKRVVERVKTIESEHGLSIREWVVETDYGEKYREPP